MQRSSCTASLKPTSAWCLSAYACSAGPAAGCSASAARAPPAGWPPGAPAALPLPPAGTGAGAACARSCGMTSAGSKLSSSATRSAVRGSIFPYVRNMAWRTRSTLPYTSVCSQSRHKQPSTLCALACPCQQRPALYRACSPRPPISRCRRTRVCRARLFPCRPGKLPSKLPLFLNPHASAAPCAAFAPTMLAHAAQCADAHHDCCAPAKRSAPGMHTSWHAHPHAQQG